MDWRLAFESARTSMSALDISGGLERAQHRASDRDLNRDLASASDVATLLAGVLHLDRARVLDDARVHSSDLVGYLTKALNSDYPLHRERALNDAAVAARLLACELDHALDVILERDYAPGGDAPGDLDLSRDLASALASYHDLLCVLAGYPGLDRDCSPAADFARYRTIARNLARCLESLPSGSWAGHGAGAWSIQVRVRAAVLLLPRSWRPRYFEEWQAELTELPSRAERRDFARRVWVQAWELRKELVGRACPPDEVRVEG
ncbi:MAG TPA: hypothetical protein VFO16_08715 [Pseudonocardiaceae bacterium]|nr:hypothetical protein [Pseudonocardiaceae bacterium]